MIDDPNASKPVHTEEYPVSEDGNIIITARTRKRGHMPVQVDLIEAETIMTIEASQVRRGVRRD